MYCIRTEYFQQNEKRKRNENKNEKKNPFATLRELAYTQKKVSLFQDKRMERIHTECQGWYSSRFLGSTIFILFPM